MVDSIIKTLPLRELCPEIQPADAASLQSVITVTFHRLKDKTIRTNKISRNKKKLTMVCRRVYTILRSTHSIITSPKDGIRINKTTIKTTAMTGTIYLDSEVLKIINHNKG